MNKLKNIFVNLIDSLYHKFHKDDIPPLNDQLNEIMSNFDFNRVATFMSWEKSHRIYDDEGNCIREEPWKVVGKTYAVPTEVELKNLAKSLLDQVIERYEPEKQFVYVGTGPFKVICRYGILELMCVIEYWSCD